LCYFSRFYRFLILLSYLAKNKNRTTKGYPLLIEQGAELLVESSPVDRNLVLKMLPKLDYQALVTTTDHLRQQQQQQQQQGIPELPSTLPETMNDELIAKYHTVLFDVHVINGFLECPDTGRKFPVKDGIPNMILHEDEI
jgi:multifunctional methyltransferase subunit TRM112